MQEISVKCFVALFENSGKQHNYKNLIVIMNDSEIKFLKEDNTVVHIFKTTEIINYKIEDKLSISKDLIITLAIGDIYLQPMDDSKEYLRSYEKDIQNFYNKMKILHPLNKINYDSSLDTVIDNTENAKQNRKFIIFVTLTLSIIFLFPILIALLSKIF